AEAALVHVLVPPSIARRSAVRKCARALLRRPGRLGDRRVPLNRTQALHERAKRLFGQGLARLAVRREEGAGRLGRLVQDKDAAEMEVVRVEVARMLESAAGEEHVVLTVRVPLEEADRRVEA